MDLGDKFIGKYEVVKGAYDIKYWSKEHLAFVFILAFFFFLFIVLPILYWYKHMTKKSKENNLNEHKFMERYGFLTLGYKK